MGFGVIATIAVPVAAALIPAAVSQLSKLWVNRGAKRPALAPVPLRCLLSPRYLAALEGGATPPRRRSRTRAK